jgi:predicted O-methyltransferase YrrM
MTLTPSTAASEVRQEPIETCLPILARAFARPLPELQQYWSDLRGDARFLAALNGTIADVPEFAGKQFQSPAELRIYRCMLYLATRALRPSTFVETGVHNGLGSAFTLLALHHNAHGTLHSIDLPSTDQVILDQGNRRMPAGRTPGWLIPAYLRDRHRLTIGPAQTALPHVLAELGAVDVFLHDSDHSYPHMMFEMGLAWGYLRRGGWLLCDNIEANTAWRDFSGATGGSPYDVASFDSPARVWKHGLLQK